MRRFFSIMLSLLLIFTLAPVTSNANVNEEIPFDDYGVRGGQQAVYNELATTDKWDETWTKSNVPLNHEWTITFSDVAKKTKVEAITIEHKGQNIAVYEPTYTNNIAKVKPRQRYLAGQAYTVKVMLKNGKKYKLDFTTTKDNTDIKDTLYAGDVLQGTVTANTVDMYEILVPNGQLTFDLRSLSTSKMDMTLYDSNGTDGNVLAFEKGKTKIELKRTLPAGKYVIAVKGTGKYELKVTHDVQIIDAADKAEALKQAQSAVYGLPSPVDVQPKHIDAIDQAMARISVARLLGVDEAVLEKLEKVITALQNIVAPIEMKVTIVGAKTIEVTFNRAVNAAAARFMVGGETPEKVTFNANKTKAYIQMAKPLEEDTKLKLSVTGIAEQTLELPTKGDGTITIEKEIVQSIEIIGSTAVRVAGNFVTIGYTVYNQYNEEMTKATVTPIATNDDGKNVVKTGGTAEKGIVRIPVDSNVQHKSEFILELESGKESVKKRITISTQSAVHSVEIKKLYNANPDNTLNERTDLEKDEFYLIIKAKDQHGTTITDPEMLNVEGALKITNTNPKVVKRHSKFVKLYWESGEIEDEDDNKKKYDIALQLQGPVTEGYTDITIAVPTGNNKSTHRVTVKQSTRTAKFDLLMEDLVTEGQGFTVGIDAWDSDNVSIKEEDILNSPISGITWVIDPKITTTPKVTKDTANNMVLKIEGSDVKKGPLTITGQLSTGLIVKKVIDVQEQIRPATWEEKSPGAIQKTIDITEKEEEKKLRTIDLTKVMIKDQYGKVMKDEKGDAITTLPEGYSIVVTKTNPSSKVLEVDGDTITPKSIGTEEVTIAIYKGTTPVPNSGKPMTFTVTDNSNYIRYEVAPIGTMYDALISNKTQDPKYNKEVVVLGVLKNGEKRRLPATAYTITVDEDSELCVVKEGTSNNNDCVGKDETSTNILKIQSKLYYDSSKTETKRDITITINSSKEPIEQEITISKEAPKVKEINHTATTIAYDANLQTGVFTIGKLLGKVQDITATDQYGVESEPLSDADKQFKFLDGTIIDPIVRFTTVKGNHLFENNGTTNAVVTDFSANSSFDAVISAGIGVDKVEANAVRVTVANAYIPSMDTAIDAIEKANLSPLNKDQNVVALAQEQELVGSDYTVTIKSSSNPTAIATDGKVTQQAGVMTVAVVFTITHKINTAFTKNTDLVSLTVDAATEVILATGSAGTAGDAKITDLYAGKKYVVQYNNRFYGIKQSGVFGQSTPKATKLDAELDAEDLKDTTEITGLDNGETYKVEEVAPTNVTLSPESLGTEGNQEITGLTKGMRYVVIESGKYYGVLANGRLSSPAQTTKSAAEALAGALSGTTITGLTNGSVYKVEKASAIQLTGVTAIAGSAAVTIKFAAPVGATDVKVEQQEEDSGKWELATTTDNQLTATSTTAIVTSVVDGTSYKFRVVVTDGAYDGTSNETQFVTPATPLVGVTAEAGYRSATIKFPAPVGATTVEIQQTINGNTWTTVKTDELLNEDSTKATVSNLNTGTNYGFRVFVKGGGKAGASNVILNVKPIPSIAIKTINGVTVPVTDGTPVSTIDDTTEYTAEIVWDSTPASFAPSTIYTATIRITPKPGYTLAGVTENFFTVTGATTTNMAGDGVVKVIFPMTAPAIP